MVCVTYVVSHSLRRRWNIGDIQDITLPPTGEGGGSVPVLESSVMSGPEKIRSRGSWSHIVSKATDA